MPHERDLQTDAWPNDQSVVQAIGCSFCAEGLEDSDHSPDTKGEKMGDSCERKRRQNVLDDFDFAPFVGLVFERTFVFSLTRVVFAMHCHPRLWQGMLILPHKP